MTFRATPWSSARPCEASGGRQSRALTVLLRKLLGQVHIVQDRYFQADGSAGWQEGAGRQENHSVAKRGDA